MKSREKSLISLGGMAVISAALIMGSEGFYNALKSLEKTPEPGTYQAGTYEASVQGFGGEVKVSVTIGEDGGLTDISIVDCSTETDTIGQAAAPQIAQAMLEAQSAEADAVSGATLTSQAVKEAVLECLAQASGGETAETEAEENAEQGEASLTEEDAESEEESQTEEDSESQGETGSEPERNVYQAGTYAASAKGYEGDVQIAVTVGNDGSIQNIQILDYSTEAPDVGQEAALALTTAMIERQSADVDVVSGATMTSNAVIEAVKEALESAESDTQAAEEETESEPDEETEKAASIEVTGSAKGYQGDVQVAVTLNGDGSMKSIRILDYSTEAPDIGQTAALELTTAMIERQSTDVDVISGATMTSNAVIEAVNAALAQAE